jgi:Sensors of blue-light using FAD
LNFEFIYTSVLAPAADVRSIADIVRRSRSRNRAHGISGILVFDGEHFCQYLEGECEEVLRLMGRIETDPRHAQLAIVHQGFGGEQRRFPKWDMAYALDTQGTVMEALADLRGPKATTFLQERVLELELQPCMP